MIDLRQLIDQSYEIAKSKGWWDKPRSIEFLILLMKSEISEALEDYRNGKAVNSTWYEEDLGNGNVAISPTGKPGEKPCGIPSELADVIIRIADFCGYKGMDLIPVAGLPNVGFDVALAKADLELAKAYEDLTKNPPAPDWSASLHFSAAVQWIINFCLANEVDIGKIIAEKAEFNKTRPARHGGKAI